MLSTPAIRQMSTDLPGLCAFRITGKVGRDDMKAMGDYMLGRFEEHDQVDMLLVFETDEGSELGASLSREAIEAQAKSLGKVRNYVVANAPDPAGGLVEAWGNILPVEARSFDTESEAMAFLQSQPPLDRQP